MVANDSIRIKSILFLLISVAMLTTLWGVQRPLYTRGEAREALVPQAMIKSGNWVLPSTYADEIPSKPPFSHWMAALGALTVGSVNPMALRLMGVIAYTAFSIYFFNFLLKRFNVAHALSVSLVLLASFEWAQAAGSLRVDTFLAVLLGVVLVRLFAWWEEGLRGVPVISIVALGAATLTKGPVAVVLTAIIFSIFLRIQKVTARKFFMSFALVFIPSVLLAGWWYALAVFEEPTLFIEKVWFENVDRFTGVARTPHEHPWIYLVAIFLVGMLPWSIFLLASIKGGMRFRDFPRKFMTLSKFTQFSIVIVIVCFLFFSIPRGKRGIYLLPVFPFLTHLLVVLFNQFSTVAQKRAQRVVETLAVATFFILVLSVGYLYAGFPFIDDFSAMIPEISSADLIPFLSSMHRVIQQELPLSLFVVTTLLVVALELRRCFPQNWLILRMSVLWIALQVLLQGPVLFAYASSVTEQTFAADIQRSGIPVDETLYSFRSEFYGTSFYLNRTIYRFDQPFDRLGYVVLMEKHLDNLRAYLPQGREILPIVRSSSSIIDPGRHALVVRIQER